MDHLSRETPLAILRHYRRFRQPAASRTGRPSSKVKGDLYDPRASRNSSGGRKAGTSASGTSSGDLGGSPN